MSLPKQLTKPGKGRDFDGDNHEDHDATSTHIFEREAAGRFLGNNDSPIKILIVERDPSQADLIEFIFREQSIVVADLCFAHSLAEAHAHLCENSFNLMIAESDMVKNFNMSSSQGLTPLEKNDLPVLLLVDHGSQRVAHDGLEPGVVDYLVKSDTSLRNLPRTVTRVMREWNHMQHRREMQESLNGNRKQLLGLNRQLQQTLSQVACAKEEWEQTMDCLHDIVILADTSGKVRRANDALMKLTGKKYNELIGAPLADIFADFLMDVQDPPLRDVEMHHPVTGRWFVLKTYSLDGIATEPGTVLTAHDYTRSKELTLQLEQANADLEKKSFELEESLKQQQATQDKILHQEKMATIGQLAAGVAHEINNPMGFILSNLSTIEEYLGKLGRFVHKQNEIIGESLEPDQRKELEAMAHDLKIEMILGDLSAVVDESIDGAVRVKKIVSDLRGFTHRDETGTVNADVNEVIESSINLVFNEIKYKAKLNKNLGTLPSLTCNPMQLSQVFMNLLVNAGQAIKKQGEISVTSTCDDEGWLNIVVADDGRGMSDDVKSKIFEPFFTTKAVGKGTGLGLSISYDIVKEHGGEIKVESKPGQGASFTVRLPVERII